MQRSFVLAILAVVTAVCAAVASLPRAAHAVTVTTLPADTSVSKCAEFRVRATIDAFQNLKAFELIYRYDPSKLQFLGTVAGEVLTSTGGFVDFVTPDTPPADSVIYDAAVLNGKAQGPGVLVYLRFRPLNLGSSTVDCQLADLRDSQNNQTIAPCTDATVNVILAPTAVALTVDPAKSNWGDKVTLTARVTPNPGAGVVQFYDNGNPLDGPAPMDTSGTATLSVTDLAVGSHSLTAAFGGDSCHAGNTSNKVTHEVNRGPTTTTLTVDPAKSTCGDKVTLTARVSPQQGGSVQFYDNGNPLGSPVPVDAGGVAVLSVSNLALDSHSLTASYSGDKCYLPSNSNKVTHVVNPIRTLTTITTDPAKSTWGQKVTLTATVTPPGRTGSVRFVDGMFTIGKAPLDSSGHATLSVNGLSVGKHTFFGIHQGDPCVRETESQPTSHEVNRGPTTTTLTVDPAKTNWGEKVTLTARVSPQQGGSVQFNDNGQPLGAPVPVDSTGTAVLSVSNLSVGAHSLTADYSGDKCYLPSSSNKVDHAVNRAPSATHLAVDPAKSTTGEKVTLTATVTPQQGGSVQFFDNGSPLGAPVPVDSTGTAVLSVSDLAVGPHSLIADYSGDKCYLPSSSNKVVHEVNPVPVTDIGISAMCVTDTSKMCATTIFTGEPWHILFTVVNKGQKPVSDWSFDIRLSSQDTIQVYQLKFQIPGHVLPVGGTETINWDSPHIFAVTEVGHWQVDVVVKVKDASNPDTSLSNNQASTKFMVDPGPTATLLSLFQAEPVNEGLELRWQFGDPSDIAEVALQRGESASGPWGEVGAERRDESGVTVALDRSVQVGRTYYYRLVVRTVGGQVLTFGPLAGTAGAGIREFALARVVPNPTRGLTRIEFTVAREARVRLSVVDVQGREVAVLVDGVQRPGVYQATWSGRTERGAAPVGLYFVRYQTPNGNLMRRVVLAH